MRVVGRLSAISFDPRRVDATYRKRADGHARPRDEELSWREGWTGWKCKKAGAGCEESTTQIDSILAGKRSVLWETGSVFVLTSKSEEEHADG